jgi:hypothetical protein
MAIQRAASPELDEKLACKLFLPMNNTHDAGRAAAPPSNAAIRCSKTADVGYAKSIHVLSESPRRIPRRKPAEENQSSYISKPTISKVLCLSSKDISSMLAVVESKRLQWHALKIL